MESLEIIGISKDLRTNTEIYYAQISVTDYLKLVGENFDRFDIQRPRQFYRAYERMKKDIMEGASLPAITLAINPVYVSKFKPYFEKKDISYLRNNLGDENNIYILDGLQRTYILKDVSKINGFVFKKDHKLLIEFWLESQIKHLVYRLIVLNAGQKPMSMRHQVELLFTTMQYEIQGKIEGLKLIKEKDEERRAKSGEFPFDRIVAAYYSYMTKSPLIKRENIIVQELSEGDLINSEEDEINMQFDDFIFYLDYYVKIDKFVFELYKDFQRIKLRSPKNWLVEEITISSFFAAISQFKTDEKRAARIKNTLNQLLENLKASKSEDDFFDLKTYSDLREGISPKKFNIGNETRKILTAGFKEYFREEGALPFKECWKLGTN